MRGAQWVRLRLRAIFRRTDVERELDEELRHHLALEAEERVRRGSDAARARREAALAFGGVERWKEECRDARGLRPLEELAQDLRYGMRSLRRRPAFTTAVVGVLGLGIGLSASLFAAFRAVLLEPLPYAEEERLVVLWQTALAESGVRDELAAANFLDLQERIRSLERVAVAMEYSLDAQGVAGPEVIATWRVSSGFFDVLGGRPLLGRALEPSDHAQGRDRVAVLAYRTWMGRFGGDPAIVGRRMILDGEPYEVLGVMPPGFDHPFEKAMWTPLWFSEEDRIDRFAAYLHGVGRLAPGATLGGLRAELDTLAARLAIEQPRSNEGVGFAAEPLRDALVGRSRPLLWTLMSGVGLLLLVACSNVAHLFLARTVARERELAVRAALGAGRSRVRRQLLAEAALLAGAGCALGVAIAWAAVGLLRLHSPPALPRRDEIALDPGVLLFAVALAALTSLAFAVVPATRAARRAQAPAAAAGDGRSVGSRSGGRLGRGLVVAGVGLSFLLLVGAGLLLRSLTTLTRLDPGYRSEGLLAVSVFLYGHYDTADARLAFVRDVTARIGALPGVRAVGVATALPLMEQIGREDAEVRRESPPGQLVTVRGAAVTEGYFAALAIPLRAGRWFAAGDDARMEPVAVISEALARRVFPGEDPVGRTLLVGFPGGPVPRRVVGVVGDVRHASLDEEPQPGVYVPLQQAPSGALHLVVAAERDPAALTGPVAREIWALAPALPLYATATMEELRRSSLHVRGFALALLGAFAGAALLLAGFGVYGLLAGATAERRRELGVRLVLGARGGELVRGVLGDSARLAALGLVLGGTVAAATTRFLGSLLYGVAPLDPYTLFAGGAVILAVAAAAALPPAMRAASTSPASTLRSD